MSTAVILAAVCLLIFATSFTLRHMVVREAHLIAKEEVQRILAEERAAGASERRDG